MNPAALLTPDVVAIVRLPVPVAQFSALCQAFPDTIVTQRGEWMVLLKPNPAKP